MKLVCLKCGTENPRAYTGGACPGCGFIPDWITRQQEQDILNERTRRLLDAIPLKGATMENAMPDNEDKPLTRDDAHRIVLEFLELDGENIKANYEGINTIITEWQAAFDAGQEALARSNLLREQQRTPRHHSMKGLPAPIGEEIARLLGRQDPPVHLNIAAMMMLLANTIDAYGRHLAMDV